MANTEHGEVEIEADGKTYTFRLGINELISLQEALGMGDDTIDEFFPKLGGNLTLEKLRLVFLHGLKRAHPEITLEQSGEIIDAIGLDGCAPVITRGIKVASPNKSSDAPQKGGKARPSHGPKS
jgi:hypothetical protein